MCCVALPCCLFDLACFFLASFSSLIKTSTSAYIMHVHVHYMYTTCTLLVLCRACWRLCWTRLLLSSARSLRDVSVSLHTLTTAYIHVHTAARHVQYAECDVVCHIHVHVHTAAHHVQCAECDVVCHIHVHTAARHVQYAECDVLYCHIHTAARHIQYAECDVLYCHIHTVARHVQYAECDVLYCHIHTVARHVQYAECDVVYCLTCSACCRLICRIAEVVAVYQISPSETRKLLLRMQARPVHLVSYMYSPFCC